MFLVDTNVLSETMRPRPAQHVVDWLAAQPRVQLSSVSVLELEYGIARLAQGEKRSRLTQWLEDLLSAPAFEVVSLDATIARAAGRLKRRGEAAGKPRPELDLIIAATAQVTGAVVATRNVEDFADLGVPLFDPFSAP
jgi:toxin FitB